MVYNSLFDSEMPELKSSGCTQAKTASPLETTCQRPSLDESMVCTEYTVHVSSKKATGCFLQECSRGRTHGALSTDVGNDNNSWRLVLPEPLREIWC